MRIGVFRILAVLAGTTLALSTLFFPSLQRLVLAAPKTLHVEGREFRTLDPQQTGSNSQATIENALFRGLLRYDENGNPAPSIAAEVPTLANGGVSPDGMTYTFKLREWKWSDGKGVVTAQDFVYSYQRLIDPKTASPYGSFFNGIIMNATEVHAGKKPVTDLGVKALDDQTFQVSLVKPVPYFNAMASMWIGYAVRKDNVERAGLPKPDSWTDPQYGEVVGSGPFRITQWDHKNKLVFERNQNFSGRIGKLDQVVLLIIDPALGAYSYYKTDSLDIAGVSGDIYGPVKADPVLSKELMRYETACTNGLAMDNAHPPFDNKLVRQAFTYALNRDLREQVIDGGIHTKHLSWLPSGVPGNDPDLGKEFDFNPDKAHKALADAGYLDGKDLPTVTFTYPDVPDGQRVADWYKDQFKQVLNVDIKLNPIDINLFLARLWDKSNALTGLYETGWCADYLHPSDWLQLVFGTGQDNNVFGYSDPEFDRLSKAADAEMDPARALQEYKAAHAILVSDFPIIFFNSTTVTRLVKPWVKNLTPNALDGGIIGGFFWEDIDIVK